MGYSNKIFTLWCYVGFFILIVKNGILLCLFSYLETE